mgnify:CR=1 FL=1
MTPLHLLKQHPNILKYVGMSYEQKQGAKSNEENGKVEKISAEGACLSGR